MTPPPAPHKPKPIPKRKPGTVFRRGSQLAAGLVFLGVFVGFAVSIAAGFALGYVALALFSAANYGAFREGEETVLLGPGLAVMATFGSLGLAIIAVVAGI